MSVRVMDGWSNTEFTHTSVDDLESIIWVLVWEALVSSTARTEKEEKWLQYLNGDRWIVKFLKDSIMTTFREPPESWKKVISKPLYGLSLLLSRLFKIATDAKSDLTTHVRRFKTLRTETSVSQDDWAVFNDQLDQKCKYYFREYMLKTHEFILECSAAQS